jgi:hypothetical protein
MSDLESQLRASVPGGRATEVQDYAMLAVARDRMDIALKDMRAARVTIAAILGQQRPAIEHIAAADIEASKAMLDLDRAIRNHPAGRVPR